jgi:LacI family transcriptional regulator
MGTNIRDIARAAKVSSTTVSRVLNDSGYVKEETKSAVLKAIKELNYTPSAVARSLSKNETNTIGVIVPDIENPFFGEVIKGISSLADEKNLNIILCDTNENVSKEIKSLNMLKEQRILGIIVTPTNDTNEASNEHLSVLENMGIPIVLVDRDVKHSNFDGVFIDNIRAAYEATSVLIKEGHRKIAIITGPNSSKPGRDRLTGYKKALRMNDIKLNERYLFYGDFKLDSGYKCTQEILKMEDRPTAILVCNNMMNLGSIKAIYENKLSIPKDMAIIGFDEVQMLDVVGLNISVVSRPTTEMGKTAMELLLKKLDKKEGTSTVRITLLSKLLLKGSEKLIK